LSSAPSSSASSSFASTQSQWARVLVATLRDAGVDQLVVSPGSRSTPVLLAAARAAITVHPIIDERSAGFFALGMVRDRGLPVALLCTSGTAAAHYLPAILEAHHARLPLVVVTADRPPELRDCAAPQAMDQTRLYGDAVRAFVDLGIASDDLRAVRGLRRRVAQAVATSRAPEPGPVHINAPFRKPLERIEPDSPAERAHAAAVDALLAEPAPRAPALVGLADATAVADLVRACRSAERGVIAAGPMTGCSGAVYQLSRHTGFPVLCEAASGARFLGDALPGSAVDGFDLLYRSASFARESLPDLIVQIGPPPISTAWNRLVAANPQVRRYVVAPHGWPDPMASARMIVQGDIAGTVARVCAELEPPDNESPWLTRLRRANAEAWRAVETELAASPSLSEGQTARAVLANLPDDAVLMLGNSLPVRVVDGFCPGRLGRVRVLAQRGVNGIDGIISGAAGTAARQQRPVVAMLGDVSFTHDIGGLAAARLARAPLVVVVVDNDGGRIFDHLPIARVHHPRDNYRDHWQTPPACDIAAAAATFGHRYERVEDADALARALTAATSSAGCTVVHAVVAPDSARAALARITAAIDADHPGSRP
jgi:2-succinyl-5-enolpyruvyl-6-hydroxy-3-cyclohexene-1-carboxylate synthase